MVLFFINGAMKIEKYDYLPENNIIDFYEYKMRFLTESDERQILKITLFDDSSNLIKFDVEVIGLKLIELNCTPFIEKYNHARKLYVRVNYKVEFEDYNENCIYGSFPIISPNYKKSLKIASVSCNKNKIDDIWNQLKDQNPDIILHAGNQIYGDYIFDQLIGKNQEKHNINMIYNEYANLYRSVYNEPIQAEAMRNSLNLMVLEANDIYNSFGSKRSIANKLNLDFTPYYSAGMKAYLNYQYQLYNDLYTDFDVDEIDGYQSINLAIDDLSNIIIGDSNIFYSVNYGNYTFIMMDERHELYHKNISISDSQLSWIKNIIKKTECKRIIIVSPRPIGITSKNIARIYGYISSEGTDDLLHPDNYDQTIKFLDIIKNHSFGKDIKIISGYNKNAFINDIKIDKYPLTEQLICGAIAYNDNSLIKRLSEWLVNNIDKLEIDKYTFGEKQKISYNNTFGYIENDKLFIVN